jgi:hypothetical protein
MSTPESTCNTWLRLKAWLATTGGSAGVATEMQGVGAFMKIYDALHNAERGRSALQNFVCADCGRLAKRERPAARFRRALAEAASRISINGGRPRIAARPWTGPNVFPRA